MTGTSDGWRRKRLSADLPQNWLHDPQYWLLADRSWRLHTHALMWAIGRTDGFIPQDMLSMLLPGSDSDREVAVKELLARSVWYETPGGWQVAQWVETQSTVSQIERNRERESDKKRRQRASVPGGTDRGDTPGGTRHGTAGEGTATTSTEETTEQRARLHSESVPGDVTRDVLGDLASKRESREPAQLRAVNAKRRKQPVDPWATPRPDDDDVV